MGPVGVVLPHILLDGGSQLPGGFEFVGIDQVIFQGSEKSFRSDIVQGLPLSVHGNPDACFLQQFNVGRIGKVGALIAIDNLRCTSAQCPFQTLKDKGFL